MVERALTSWSRAECRLSSTFADATRDDLLATGLPDNEICALGTGTRTQAFTPFLHGCSETDRQVSDHVCDCLVGESILKALRLRR